MNKIKEYIKVAAILIYGYCSAWITPYLWRLALGIRKGIQNDVEGEMFIFPSIIQLIIFAVIDFAIVMYIIKSREKTKTQKIIIISVFALSMLVAYISWGRYLINLFDDIIYLISR